MLQHLSIRNIVLIDACELSFAGGLNVLTGETGAGKSILLDALGLVLGARADARLVRSGAASASVTAEFDISQIPQALEALDALGLEPAETLVLRRTLDAQGKGRAFVNDAPVSVGALKQLGETLVEIHGQHDQRGLLDPASHLRMLDEYAGVAPARAALETQWQAWRRAVNDRLACEADIAAAAREEDYLRHIARELGDLDPRPGEETLLLESRALASAQEKIASLLQDALREVQQPRGPDASLRAASRLLARAPAAISARLSPAVEALERAASEAEEAVAQLERSARESLPGPQALEPIEERLHAMRDAARKHRVTVDELAQLRERTEEKIARIDNANQDVAAFHAREAEWRERYLKQAQKLGKIRRKVAKQLEEAMAAELAPLKMGATRLHVAVEPLPESAWGPRGSDSVRFLAATNKGAELAPLAQIASGGELSRFMLAMKAVLAGSDHASIIFDEIDTGTGGAVADAIGKRLAQLSGTRQVLAVTHLPQVAARGGHHLRIWKEESRKATHTRAAVLDESARREELARMLAGAEVTAEARHAADRLLESAVG